MLQPLTSHVVGRGAAPAPLPDAAPAAAAPEPTEFDVDAILGQRGFYFSERTLPLDLGQLGRVDLDQIYQDVDVEQLQVHLEALTFANLELGFGGAPAGTLLSRVRGFLQLALIVSLPAIAHQPAGVFMYWLPAASFGTTQLLLFRHSALVRRVIGLPPPRAFVRPGKTP